MKKILLSILAGAVIGSLITAFLFIHFQPRPGPEKTKIVYRDKIVYAQVSGQITTQKPLGGQEGGDTILPPNPSTDFKTSVPVTGEIKTSHVDLQFSGTTEVEKKGDQLSVNTIFDPDVVETIYEEPPKTWHVGLDAYYNLNTYGIGGYLQKDFWAWKDFKAFGRIEVKKDAELKAGIEYSF